ncbi:hypothetical protein RJT34_17900 [Clitoria ternatea]|uniref:Glycosyltransferase n=1 Tax=Clitoria ternatea TaxID=43366 RepID=A0AAN9JA53_CLITE
MESETNHHLNVIFLPYPATGHMNPMVDIARLFAKHGASVTIITTHANALTYQKAIENDLSCGYHITTQLLPFPSAQVGLPQGVENFKDVTSHEEYRTIDLGMELLKDRIELLFQDLQPDCLVTDMLYPWTVDSASKLGIPRLYFYCSSYFSNCASYSVRNYKPPHESLVSDTKFTVPGFPTSVEMTTLQLAERVRTRIGDKSFRDALCESESRSYGALYNSFHELESDFEQYYNSTMGIKSWSIGPVSVWINKDSVKKENMGLNEELAQEPEWLGWLNNKQNQSVLYVNFGSLTRLPHSQLVELAHGLETSGHDFIWVIRKKHGDHDECGDNFLQDFEQKMKETGKGYVIWNWAPQSAILDHNAIGGVVTHCGWNTVIESLNVGLPMITWPMFAEQFYNEALLTHVLKVGVSVRSEEKTLLESTNEGVLVTREEISKAVAMLMEGGEESKEMRKRAREIGDGARKSIEESGSSFNNLMRLLDELKSLKMSRMLEKTN